MEGSTKEKLEHIVGSHKGKAGDSTVKKAQLAPQLETNQLGRLSGRLRGGGKED